jgi:hypothetical protein
VSESLARLQALIAQTGGLIAGLLDGTECIGGDAVAAGAGAAACAARSAGEAAGELTGAGESAIHAAGMGAPPARLAAAGPRAAGQRDEYELFVEAIYEGYLLHYGVPRVVRSSEQDLRLLAGDQLYALGLARLVAIGDTQAVHELADTITLSALAHAAGERELADAVWQAGARAVGWGPSEQHRHAKQLLCEGRPGALDAMRTSASLASA